MKCHEQEIECWRPIPGFPLYRASNLGRVQNIETERILKPQPITSRHSPRKYYQVKLQKPDGTPVTKSLHRLIAKTFLGDSELEINHLSGDKTDNGVDNLEYTTHSANCHHALQLGLSKQPPYRLRFSDDDVREMRRMKADGISFKEIMARFEITNGPTLRNILSGRSRGNVI